MRHLTMTASSVLLLTLAACGGGSDSPAPSPPPPPPPPPANTAPEVTSASAVSIDENTTGQVYTFTTSDADGDPVSLSVVAGGDEGDFDIDTSAGTVSLASGLDFEAPQDDDTDNVYEITVEASDGQGGVTSFTLAISVEDVNEDGSLIRIGTGFSQPLFVTPIPGTGQLAVVQKAGRIRVLDPDTGTIAGTDFLDVSSEVSTNSERGLLGLAFSPDFATDRTFYVNLTNTGGDTEIRRYQTGVGTPTQADPGTADLIPT